MSVQIEIDKASKQRVAQSLKKLGNVPFDEALIMTAFKIKALAQIRLREKGHIVTSRLRNSLYVKYPNQSKANEVGRKNSFAGGAGSDNGLNYTWNASAGRKGGSGNRDLTTVDLKINEVAIGSNVEYAAAIERGARPHKIVAKNFPVLGNKKVGFFGKEVNHPGFAGDSYLYWSARNINTDVITYHKKVVNDYYKKNKR